MSEFVLALCCLGCWANGVIIGWCLYDFKSYKRNLDKAKEAAVLLDNAEKTYRCVFNVVSNIEGAKLVSYSHTIVRKI